MKNNYYDVTTGKQAELSPLQKMYLELEKIIEPRLLGDFCGYNEETQGFDIVLATKEIIEAKEQECENYKKQFKADTKEMERLEQENIRSLSYSECLEKRVEKLEQEKTEIKKYLGISDKTIMQRLEELQEFKDEARYREYMYKDALDEISQILESYYHNGISEIPKSQMELTTNLLNICEYKLCKISNIINKIKEK